MQDKLVMGLLGSQGPERERVITASSLMKVLLLFEKALDDISFSISNCTYTYRFLVLLSKEEVPTRLFLANILFNPKVFSF